MHRRKVCRIALAGMTVAFLGGCGGGSKSKGGDTDGGDLPLGEFVRLDLGRSPFGVSSIVTNAPGTIGMTREIRTRSASLGYRAYLLTEVGWKDVHPPDATNSGVAAINDQGQVVVFGAHDDFYASEQRKRAWLYAGGTFTEIRSSEPDIYSVEVGAIANDGIVLGSLYLQGNTIGGRPQKAFVWRDGVMTTLPGTKAVSINSQGQILFFAQENGAPDRWILRQPDGSLLQLRETYPEWIDFYPSAIEDSGDVLGYVYIDGISNGMAYLRNGEFDIKPPETGFTILRTRNSAGDNLMPYDAPNLFILVRPDGARVDLAPFLPTGENANPHIGTINNRRQVIGRYQSFDALSGIADMAFVLTPPSVVSALGSATVRLSRLRNSSVDVSRFTVDAAHGALLTPDYLEAEIVARPNASGARRIRLSLNSHQAIEVGFPYPVANPTYNFSMGGRVSFFTSNAGSDSPLYQLRGVFIVDRMTTREIVLRLIDVEVGSYADPYGNPPADIKLNATITLPR